MSRKERIEQLIVTEFTPSSYEVIDESHLHAGHHGHSGRDETHFVVSVTSQAFEGKSLIQRHRMVYDLLKEEIDGGIHALTIRAFDA